MSRPGLTSTLAVDDFRAFYWLKEELVAFCQTCGLGTGGSKQDLAARITVFLETGTRPPSVRHQRRAGKTMPPVFSRQTTIGPDWHCTEGLRAFFVQELGPHFHFDHVMRTFIKEGAGRTLDEAIGAWEAARQQAGPAEIAPQFEYNRYLRAFFRAHPGTPRHVAIAAWNAHKAQRRHPGDDLA